MHEFLGAGPLVSTLRLYGPQWGRVFLLAPSPRLQPLSGWGRGGLGNTQVSGLMPSADSVPGVPLAADFPS